MENIGATGYAAVGILYLVLTVLLAFGWRGSRVGAALIAACLANSAWGAGLALEPLLGLPDSVVYLLEVLRTGSWLAFLSLLAGRLGLPVAVVAFANVLWVGLLMLGTGLWFARQIVVFDLDLGSILFPGGLLVALAGLVLIEQLLRNSPGGTRWRLVPLAIGIGGLCAYDLFLYSQALLFSGIDPLAWAARGAVNLVFLPLIAIAARRNPQWDLDIFVSRQVVFYTTTLIAVGLYLIVMSAGGYLLLIYGGNWGPVAQIVFLVGAVVVLCSLFFSARLRAKFKVFLSKHFFRNRYDYREEWLRLIATLAEFSESGTRQIAVRALAQVVESPSGLLWLYDQKAGQYSFVAAYGTTETAVDLPLDDPLIGFIRDQGWLVDLEEYREVPDLYGTLDMPARLLDDPGAWLVVPLIARRELIGIVQLNKPPLTRKLNYEDRDLLKTIGHHVAVHLAQERSDNLLAEAQQFQAYNRLTAFLMHDLNNLIAQQSLIVKNAERHKRNPEFVDDAMLTIANSVARMKQVMEQLRTGKPDSGRRKTLLKFLVSAAVDRCREGSPEPVLAIDGVDAEVEVNAERFIMVLTHLIQNAQDATDADGSVTVRLAAGNGLATVSVADTGTGMSSEFLRDRLFRPFDSTKGSQGMGIGAYQAREFARQMGGDLRARSKPGQGTTMTLTLPVAE